MSTPQEPSSQRGFTILEVLILITVLAIVAQAFAVFVSNASKSSVRDREKAEATEHAVQMLEELRNVVMDDTVAVTELDKYNDSRNSSGNPLLKYTLTVNRNVTNPSGNTAADYVAARDSLSGNPLGSQGYIFVRHVEILPDVNDDKMRSIRVRIWRAKPNNGSASASTPTAATTLPLVELSSKVRSLASGNNPSQVVDLYLVALENVPGWWSRTSNLIPLMRASVISLQSRNPGLVLRPHWIRRMSYGRDVEYTPEVNNSTLSSVTGAFKKAYIYPGYINYSDGNDYYYLPSWFKGRFNQDGSIQTTTVDGYPMADQYNHAMRYPDELNLYAIHQLVNSNAGADAPEMSLRMLMEKLNDPNDGDLINAIVINLHGEMLPVVPLRNYSDAAKDPAYFWSTRSTPRAWRAVTHPEHISYSAGADVTLDTYVYDMNASGIADPITPSAEDDLVNYVTLFVPGADLTNLGEVDRMQGNSRVTYAWKRSASATGSGTVAWNYVTASASVTDGVTNAQSRWWADTYTPSGRSPGLRIVFQGATPTARAYAGLPYHP